MIDYSQNDHRLLAEEETYGISLRRRTDRYLRNALGVIFCVKCMLVLIEAGTGHVSFFPALVSVPNLCLLFHLSLALLEALDSSHLVFPE